MIDFVVSVTLVTKMRTVTCCLYIRVNFIYERPRHVSLLSSAVFSPDDDEDQTAFTVGTKESVDTKR